MNDSETKRWLQILLSVALTFLFLYMMAPFVVATLLGAVIAILIHPFFDRIRKRIPPSVAAFIVTLGLTLGILVPIGALLLVVTLDLVDLLTPILTGDSIQNLSNLGFIKTMMEFLTSSTPFETEWLRGQGMKILIGVVEKVSRILTSSLAEVPGLLLGFLVVVLSCYFSLLDGEKFVAFLFKISPLKRSRSLTLFHAFETSCRGVVVGLFAAATVQGILVTVFFLITSLPKPVLMGALTMALSMIPLVGAFPVWSLAAIYLFFVQKSIVLGAIMVGAGIIISLSDNVIRSWITAGSSRMHPFIALISVFGAIKLIGAPGIFLGPVIAAVFISLLKIWASDGAD